METAQRRIETRVQLVDGFIVEGDVVSVVSVASSTGALPPLQPFVLVHSEILPENVDSINNYVQNCILSEIGFTIRIRVGIRIGVEIILRIRFG